MANHERERIHGAESLLDSVVLGGTGLVGGLLLDQLANDPEYGSVLALGRRKATTSHKNVRDQLFDFNNRQGYSEQFRGDVLFLALGTTVKVAGSKEAQYLVDHSYQLWAAEAGRKNTVGTCVLVSSFGADLHSPFFYPRMKAELERDICALAFERTIIMRPSFLDGPRKEKRPGESLALRLLRPLPRLSFLDAVLPVQARDVAIAMRRAVRTLPPGTHLWGPPEIVQKDEGADSE